MLIYQKKNRRGNTSFSQWPEVRCAILTQSIPLCCDMWILACISPSKTTHLKQYHQRCCHVRPLKTITESWGCIKCGQFLDKLRNCWPIKDDSAAWIFDVLLTVHLSIILGNDQLDTQVLYFIIRLLQSSTCFEQRRAHHQEVKLY